MKCKRIFLILLALLLSTAALLSGVACTEPDAPPAAPQGEPPALEGWKHQVTNTEILETETFLDAPDSVVYYDKSFENVVALSAEDGLHLKRTFGSMERTKYIKATRENKTLADIEEQIATYGGIEFRYDQRRKYVGKAIYYSSEDGGKRTWNPSQIGEFDAVLVVPNGEKCFWIVPYLGDTYCLDFAWIFNCKNYAYTDFCVAWQEVLHENIDVRPPVPQTKMLDGAEYTLIVNNESTGTRMYMRMIDGVKTPDYFLELYDQNDVFIKMTKSIYTLTPEDEAAARALLEQSASQMLRGEREYTFIFGEDGKVTLFENYEEPYSDYGHVYFIRTRFDPETGEWVLVSKEPCC